MIALAKPAVIDTNIVVAGLISASKDSPVVIITEGMMSGRFPFLLSMNLIDEYRRALNYPKVARLHALSGSEIESILIGIIRQGIVRDPQSGEYAIADQKDWFLFDLLRAVDGTVLVTGDQLLHREAPGSASTLSPAKFCQLNGF